MEAELPAAPRRRQQLLLSRNGEQKTEHRPRDIRWPIERAHLQQSKGKRRLEEIEARGHGRVARRGEAKDLREPLGGSGDLPLSYPRAVIG